MARIGAVGFFLLVEVKAYFEVFAVKSRIGVKPRVSGGSERSDKAHFFAVFALKRIAGAPEEIDGIVGDA